MSRFGFDRRLRTAAALAVLAGLATSLLPEDVEAQSRRRSSRRGRSAGVEYPASGTGKFTTGSEDPVVAFANERLTQAWKDNEIAPSPIASDAEWLRRLSLDVIGRIPSADEVEAFLADRDPAKRAKKIDELLDSPDYVRNMTTIWTNLGLGRGNIDEVSRDGMRQFWREAFARNRPWDEVIVDLMTAEGYTMVNPDLPRPEGGGTENGAVNYWIAQMQMQDEMVQATAKTARLFLGIQVQCTQCHDHPFNDWQQDQFWQFNSFFRQMQARTEERYNPDTGRMDDWYSEVVWRDFGGPVFFEKRSGEMKVAYPEYQGAAVNPDEYTDRRKEFAKLIVEGEEPLVAKAMVNRTWGHFFGYGFTKPVDDMGPHNPASDPILFDRLTEEFVKSRYDVKQLIRWIANSEAYNLTSAFREDGANDVDDPAAGETPLFSHCYVKSLTPEQLFDSLIVATDAHRSGRGNWEEQERQRRQWLQQFVIAFDTDENDEATTFNGTIPQALMMMNGDLVQDAVSAEKGGFLRETLLENPADAKRIERLYLATLSRRPSAKEAKELELAFKTIADPEAKLQAYQDLFWALLNSNEFIFNH